MYYIYHKLELFHSPIQTLFHSTFIQEFLPITSIRFSYQDKTLVTHHPLLFRFIRRPILIASIHINYNFPAHHIVMSSYHPFNTLVIWSEADRYIYINLSTFMCGGMSKEIRLIPYQRVFPALSQLNLRFIPQIPTVSIMLSY